MSFAGIRKFKKLTWDLQRKLNSFRSEIVYLECSFFAPFFVLIRRAKKKYFTIFTLEVGYTGTYRY